MTEANLGSVYVDTSDRVLDPTLIDMTIMDRMPEPSGWRMLVLPGKGS